MGSRQPNRRPRIYQGADGDYHTYVTVGRRKDGKLDRRHIRAKTPTEVAEKVEALAKTIEGLEGAAPPKGATTLSAWLEHWLENIVRPNRTYKTWAGYRSICSKHLVPRLGSFYLSGWRNPLEPEHVEAMLGDLKRAGAAPAYRLQIYRVLDKALKTAKRRGRASRNVCALIDAPEGRNRKIKAHTLDEAQAIVRAAATDPLAARWLIGILLGARQGEVLGLRWHRLYLTAAEPYLELETQIQRHTWEHGCPDPAACVRERAVCRTEACRPAYEHGCDPACRYKVAWRCPQRSEAPCRKHTRACPKPCPAGCTDHARSCPQRTGGGLVETELKTEKSVRPLALPPQLIDALITHREQQQQHLAEAGVQWTAQMYVFQADNGGPIDPRADHVAWEELLERAGLPDSRLHAARHTAGTLMLATGTDIRVVQEVLGHSRITTTEEYVDVAQGLRMQAAQKIADAVLNGQLAALLQPSSATTKPQP